ncbi:MAG: radical SAM protein [Candidatus Zixiibacteriota bacterium]
MPKLTAARKARIAGRTLRNILIGKPVTVSFEVTYNCNARCEHCDLGDYVKEPRLGPEAFARWMDDLQPAVAQISGGEPMLRKDLADIIGEMRRRDSVAVFVLTTNVTLLNEEKYLNFREAGVDQFSFSLDYPDERHNDFRHLKKNFEHIRDLSQRLAEYGNDDIILACVVQSDNFHELTRMAELAKEWGVGVNFSTYNALRTGKKHFLVNREEDLEELSGVVDRLVEMQKDGYPILTSEWTMRQMIDFFRNGEHPRCRAGRRFLIVGPWGKLTPCGMFRQQYESHEALKEEFTAYNRCTNCFTAIRANSEKAPLRMLADAVRAVQRR